MNTLLEVKGLSKRFVKNDTATVALRDFDLSVKEGSFVSILGRSGCGKSTMLNLLAGLTAPSSGEVHFRGRPLSGPHTEIGYLTQSDTLMPWRDVQRNVEMPMELAGVPAAKRSAKAADLIERVGLAGFERSYPRELSGGMRRRASLARMLVGSPDTLLMDEPFGALDAQLRHELQQELLRLWSGTRQTVVFVTHDIEEAILLADRVVVLGGLGRVLVDRRIDLPRPRVTDDVQVDPTYIALYKEMADALKGGGR